MQQEGEFLLIATDKLPVLTRPNYFSLSLICLGSATSKTTVPPQIETGYYPKIQWSWSGTDPDKLAEALNYIAVKSHEKNLSLHI